MISILLCDDDKEEFYTSYARKLTIYEMNVVDI